MGLEANFSKEDIKKFLNKKLDGYRKAIEMRLARTGEEFIILCKEKGAYRDRTGNLRNAPFYIVMLDGKRISSKLGPKSEQFAEKVSQNYKIGYALICGDGMEYAASVESMGKDVITGSAQIIEERLRQALNRIKNLANGT